MVDFQVSQPVPPAPATTPSSPQSVVKEHPDLAGKETRECGLGEDPKDYQEVG